MIWCSYRTSHYSGSGPNLPLCCLPAMTFRVASPVIRLPAVSWFDVTVGRHHQQHHQLPGDQWSRGSCDCWTSSLATSGHVIHIILSKIGLFIDLQHRRRSELGLGGPPIGLTVDVKTQRVCHPCTNLKNFLGSSCDVRVAKYAGFSIFFPAID